MKIERIDLYDYFNIKRPDGAQGYLTCYLMEKYEEFCPNRTRPAMLVIAGGGYAFVSQREKEPLALFYLSKSFQAFTLDYSIAPIAYPYQLIEGCMAMAYIRENAEKLLVDPEHVASIGFSAGGHLCGMLATLYKEKVVEEFLGERAKLCRPDAVILSYPVISSSDCAHKGSIINLSGGNEELFEKISLEKQVDSSSSPAFIWATANDGSVPAENSLLMAMAYKKAGVPFELHVFESGIHGLSLCNREVNTINVPASTWAEMAVTFLRQRGFDVVDRW